ncbi:protein Hook homolog 2 isoform X2 [Falco rusticolus]|uniref:protein Hook homolog 2 isoform X2 n=1 Tax=Falco rusticolus TaxID=120794 RepID=UPI0018869D13|nr:protein Hook homolog 2 isoform X2 [Falco rusticolus]
MGAAAVDETLWPWRTVIKMAAARDRKRRCQLQTFAPPSPCTSPQDLASGVALAHVLHSIDASWFNETWLGRIRNDAEDNWRLKVSNLRKVLQSVLEYWQDVLGQAVADQHVPDVALAAQHADPEQLGKLVRLVLGCAVSCERREEHIQRIMTLEESVQHVVMTAIQELLDKEPMETMAVETYGNFDTQSRRYYFLSEEPEEVGGPQQRCLELEQQVAVLLEEKGALAEENRALREETSQLEAAAAGATAKKLLLLQTRVEQLQEENYRLESGKEELQARCSQLEQEARGLQARAEELSGLAGEARALRDEMDVLRASSARAGRLEAAVAAYRGRAAAAGDLRRWLRALEERHAGQLRRAAVLQQQLGRAQAGCAQLEAARRQVEELSGQQAEAALRAEKWQLEFQNLQEKFEALNKEKERLLEERDALREANEELRCAQVQQSCLRQADAVLEKGAAPAGNLAAEILPAELRETVAWLRRENRRLQAQEVMLRRQRDQLQRRLRDTDQQRLEATGMAEVRTVQGDPQEELLLLEDTLEELEELPEAGAELQGDEELESPRNTGGTGAEAPQPRHSLHPPQSPEPAAGEGFPDPALGERLRAEPGAAGEGGAAACHRLVQHGPGTPAADQRGGWAAGSPPRGSVLPGPAALGHSHPPRPAPPWPPPQPLSGGVLGGVPPFLGWSHFRHYRLGVAPHPLGGTGPCTPLKGGF